MTKIIAKGRARYDGPRIKLFGPGMNLPTYTSNTLYHHTETGELFIVQKVGQAEWIRI